MKRKVLSWFAFYSDFNSDNLKRVNVLGGLEDDIKKRVKKEKATTREEVKEILRRELMWRYWCKSEWEVIVSGLFAKTDEERHKIDVWYQLEPNLDIITDYVIGVLNLKVS